MWYICVKRFNLNILRHLNVIKHKNIISPIQTIEDNDRKNSKFSVENVIKKENIQMYLK